MRTADPIGTPKNQSSPPTRPSKGGLVRGTEVAERGYIFWRIGERPILQKPHGLVIEPPETLKVFDLVASHHQIKKFHLRDLSNSAVKAIYFVLPLM
ncbi:MAG: hypothetical protein A2162_05255 [Deltaproteobacteria bacterium RBG_13_52_11b]|nr:MAG: hypothetical protein A2162_05255 [Deltaproteobacteria bacterium RBG_13_52_11b]